MISGCSPGRRLRRRPARPPRGSPARSRSGLGDDLLDAARDGCVRRRELRQRESGDLAADRIETGEGDRLGRVVDDQVDPGRLLERADVAALAADDPALHLVVGEVDDRHGVLGGVVGGDPLDRRQDVVARLLAGLLAARSRSIGCGELDRVVFGLVTDGLDRVSAWRRQRTAR